MKNYTIEEVLLNTNRMPGLSSQEDINLAIKWLEDYIVMRDIYLNAFFHEPVGLTLESKIDGLKHTKKMRGFV